MTLEILNLTTQIQRWLNARVAEYLAAQAERLPPLRGKLLATRQIASR